MTGLDKELEFSELIKELGFVYLSTGEQDMREHWDVAVKFDVKSRPRGTSSNEYRWVEITNVRGDKGWLQGDSSFIAFEEHDYWIIVSTEKLLNFVRRRVSERGNRYVTQKEWKRNPQPFLLYQRDNRKDLITMVPIVDLCFLGKVIAKPEEQRLQQLSVPW